MCLLCHAYTQSDKALVFDVETAIKVPDIFKKISCIFIIMYRCVVSQIIINMRCTWQRSASNMIGTIKCLHDNNIACNTHTGMLKYNWKILINIAMLWSTSRSVQHSL